MPNVNTNSLLKKAEQYRVAIKQAKETGEYEKAKGLYISASKVFVELADQSSGDFRKAYRNKADELTALANALPSKSNKSDDGSVDIDIVNGLNTITFDDVAGLHDVKKAIDTRIIKPRQYPEVYKALKKKPGGNILMYGVPGTGKTMLAKAIANSVNATFREIKCSQIAQKFFGESEQRIKEIFDTAREHEVAVIFFDEFESIGAKRTGNSDSAMSRLVPELLSQIDGFQGSFNTLLVIAATNRPQDIDTAFLRPGRFSEFLHVPPPDKEARKHIIIREYEGVPMEDGIDIDYFDYLAERIEGFSGADVWEFCNKSKDPAADCCITEFNGDVSKLKITKANIEDTLKNIKSTISTEDLKEIAAFKKQYDNL